MRVRLVSWRYLVGFDNGFFRRRELAKLRDCVPLGVARRVAMRHSAQIYDLQRFNFNPAGMLILEKLQRMDTDSWIRE